MFLQSIWVKTTRWIIRHCLTVAVAWYKTGNSHGRSRRTWIGPSGAFKILREIGTTSTTTCLIAENSVYWYIHIINLLYKLIVLIIHHWLFSIDRRQRQGVSGLRICWAPQACMGYYDALALRWISFSFIETCKIAWIITSKRRFRYRIR